MNDKDINKASKVPEDFMERVRSEESYIRRVARRLVRPDDVEEVVQETMLKAWNARDSYREDVRFRGWLGAIAQNTSIDIRRRERKYREADGEDAEFALANAPAEGNPEEILMSSERDRGAVGALGAALEALPERQREAIRLFHLEGLSQIETGERMGISDEAVESLLARGRRALKIALQGDSKLEDLLDTSASDEGARPADGTSASGPEETLPKQQREPVIPWEKFFKGKEDLKKWEKLEIYPRTRGLMEQALSCGATTEELEGIFKQEGFDDVTKSGFQNWLAQIRDNLSGDNRLAAYVLRLRAINEPPITEGMRRECHNIVREYLLKSEDGRTTLWRFLPETRALALAILKKGDETEGEGVIPDVARAVSRVLGISPRISDSVVDGMVRRAEKKGGVPFAEQLFEGMPPFTERLSPDQIQAGEEEAEKQLKIAQARRRERSPLMEDDESRAFILALLEDVSVPIPRRLEVIVRRKYGPDVLVPDFKDVIDRAFRGPADTRSLEEKRIALAEEKRFGIPDAVYKRMKREAFALTNEHNDETSAIRRRSGLAKGRQQELEARTAYAPLADLVEDIRDRRTCMPDPNARATTKVSWQQSKEHGDITTVAISISGTDPKEAQQFYTYVRHELEEMEAGLDNELRDALTTPEKPPVSGVVLFGPDEEDLALFSFGRGGAQ